MNDFKREERYIVVKLADLTPVKKSGLSSALLLHGIPTRECVVVEPDWPIYDETWENVQRLAEGKPSIAQERDALAAHVDRLFETWTNIVDEGDRYSPEELEEAMCAVFSEGASASLVRLIAQKQAEIVAKLSREVAKEKDSDGPGIAVWLDQEAANLHRQAESDEQAIAVSAMSAAVQDSPETSLAKLKAQWQTEAIIAFHDEWPWEDGRPSHKDVWRYARKQAGGERT